MDRHLVPVEVRVEGRADQRVNLDGLAFDQQRFKRLDAQPVQGGRPIQQHRMPANHLLQDIPNLRPFTFHQLLGRFDGSGQTTALELAEDKGLEQFQRHTLGQPALM